MVVLCLLLVIPSLVLSLALTAGLIRLGHALGTYDSGGVAGQVKSRVRRVPNTGGVAIFGSIAVCLVAGLVAAWVLPVAEGGSGAGGYFSALMAQASVHFEGVRERTPLGVGLVGCLFVLHVLGLWDDRRPLHWVPKLVVMAGLAVGISWFGDTRLLTGLDGLVGGSWLSVGLTVVWFLAVTNAMNFMDNMDGLSAGTAAVAGLAFLAAALVAEQWFVAAVLSVLIGACLGFLFFNFPVGLPGRGEERTVWRARRARIYMGDGGSLVLGFLLAFLTTRTTYYAPETASPHWYALLMPAVVLAIPLYDLVSVTAIRLSQGRSPFVGDLQHFSHRLVRRGLSPRVAVGVIWMLTGVTAVGGVALSSVSWWQAGLVGLQTALVLGVLAVMERGSVLVAGAGGREGDGGGG